MAWTETEISQFQIDNNKALAEVNATLRPDVINPENRIGIFLAGQNGDAMSAMSVLKYKKELWPDAEIIWFANYPVAECFKYSCINEVRPWPWAGNGLEPGTPDYWPLLTIEGNKLNQTLKLNYKDTADIRDGYFPAPYMLHPSRRHGWDYPNCSKKVFGVPDNYEWHPLLNFSVEEVIKVAEYMSPFAGQKNLIFETFAGSGQSRLDESMVYKTIELCKSHWTNCNIFFSSHKFLKSQEHFPQNFFDQENVYSCAHFTVRQFGLLNDYMDLIISVSSGITVACSAWNRKAVPILQFCGSWICSTKSLAEWRPFELVTADGKYFQDAKLEFELRLISLLNKYQ